jgi:hypothetical protein
MEDFAAYSALADLPPLVRKQRALEATIVPLAAALEAEKAIRKDIDALLVDAGIVAGDGVTCLGYDVVHHVRSGSTHLYADVLTEQLVAAGVDRALVVHLIGEATETGDPSAWATVKPSKGAKVRPVTAAKAIPAKASLKRKAS